MIKRCYDGGTCANEALIEELQAENHALRDQTRQEIADILNGKTPMVEDPIFDPIETYKAILQVSLVAAAALNEKLQKELEVWEFEVGSTIATYETRITAADALAEVAQCISDNAFTDEDGPEFIIRPEDKVELDDALCEYREATSG